jgi:hypothetical protein
MASTVRVLNRWWNDIRLQTVATPGTPLIDRTVVVAGRNAVTSVDADFFAAWLKQNADSELLSSNTLMIVG